MNVVALRTVILILAGIAAVDGNARASDDDLHPLLSSTYWVNLGIYFAAHDFDASADGTVSGRNGDVDFERAFDLDDGPDLFIGEFGWQFGEKWGLAVQYFRTDRAGQRILDETVEWGDISFEANAEVSGRTEISILRSVVSRRFWDGGPHSFRLSAGLHWLEIDAELSGTATLADQTTEFRREVVSASAPVPNLGGRYSYSPSDRWLFSARIDWLSADIDEYSGGIWNASAGVNFRVSDYFGAGLAYQFFQIDGSVDSNTWTGDLQTRFSGPNLYFSAYW